MNRYLYGDGTDAPLESDFFGYLTGLLDAAVAVLAWDEQRRELETRVAEEEQRHEVMDRELGALASRLADLHDRWHAAEVRECAAAVVDAGLMQIDALRARVLEATHARMVDIRAHQGAVPPPYLEQLLLSHDPPFATAQLRATLHTDTGYVATMSCKDRSGLAWDIELDIPPGHLLSAPLRMDELVPELVIKLADKGGWLRRSPSVRMQRLSKDYLSEIESGSAKATLRLRSDPAINGEGYDVVLGAARYVYVMRVHQGMERKPFQVDRDDERDLRAIHDRLAGCLRDLRFRRRRMCHGRLDGIPVDALPDPFEPLQRLLAQAAPVALEIARRSPNQDVLLLRRVLSESRRDEIYASRAALRTRLEKLPVEWSGPFQDLGPGHRAPLSDDIEHPTLEPPSIPSSSTPRLPRLPAPSESSIEAKVRKLPSVVEPGAAAEPTAVSAGVIPLEDVPTSVHRPRGSGV